MPAVTTRAAKAAGAATLPPLPPMPPFSVNKRPQQLLALPVQQLRLAEVIQIARQIANQQSTMWQCARPIIEPRLEGPRTLLCLDPPTADLDFLVDFQHTRHLEHEPRYRERRLQRRARTWIELGGIPHESELLFI